MKEQELELNLYSILEAYKQGTFNDEIAIEEIKKIMKDYNKHTCSMCGSIHLSPTETICDLCKEKL